MNNKTRNITGWTLSVVVLILMAASAIDKISGSAHSLEMTRSFGITPAIYRLLGLVELTSVILFIIPGTGVLGLFLLSSYLGGAIATHLQHGQSIIFPAAIEALIWIAALIRFPQLWQRARIKKINSYSPDKTFTGSQSLFEYFKLYNYLNFFPARVSDLCVMENIKNIEEAILTYTSAWNETEREAILEKISKCWAPGGTYTDRLTDTITGPDAITELIISSYGQMGPRTFQVLGEPQVHHQSGRFRWLAIRPEGYPVEGMDYFEFDRENRITSIVGFF